MKNLIFVRLIDALFRSLITIQQSDFTLIVLEVDRGMQQNLKKRGVRLINVEEEKGQ